MRNGIVLVNRMQTDGTFIIAADGERNYTLKGGVLYTHFQKTGEWRVSSKETCAEFGHKFGDVQQAAYDKATDEFFAEYRKRQLQRSPEQIAEERMEARAAHGKGVKLVNILTGETYTT